MSVKSSAATLCVGQIGRSQVLAILGAAVGSLFISLTALPVKIKLFHVMTVMISGKHACLSNKASDVAHRHHMSV